MVTPWSTCILAYAVLFLQVHAVKDYLFKDCDKSGFCHRNRHYAKQATQLTGSNLPYTFSGASINVSDTAISGTLVKNVPSFGNIEFPWSISVLEGDSLRFKIDENRPKLTHSLANPKRYGEAIDAAFEEPVASKTRLLNATNLVISEAGLTYHYGPSNAITVEMQFSPPKVTVSKNGEIQATINEQCFLNIEHFRKETENDIHLNRDLESDFDMFHDSFGDSKNDKMPFGPESVSVDVELHGYSHVFGLSEHADSLSLKDTKSSNWPYRLYNVDIFEYETDSRMPMYGSIPLLVGAKENSAVGVFWVNSADTFIDIEKKSDPKEQIGSVNSHWMSENGVLDVIILIGDRPTDINYKYGLLTGFAALPQEFALGYHQCRWNYNDVADVLDISAQMDEHLFPVDTIWLDIEYADKKQYFTWNEATFGENVAMMKKLDETGRNLVVIIDPHLKTGYDVSDNVEKHQIGIKNPHNSTFKGHCWPGESVWIDSMNPSSQKYWDALFANTQDSFLSTQSNVHLWNDMNEPSVFDGPETTSPKDSLHFGDFEHRSVHNLWGMTFHELTHKSLTKRLAQTTRQRPFILTRAYYAGSQRTAAMWTGDNMATWEYLSASIPMILTSNVVGMPFSGADVGGFFGDPSKELLTRWYQAGIWYPFFRAHAHIDSRRREPYIAGDPYTSIMREAVKLRYSLLPTLYTLFHEASIDGTPVWKPVFYESPADRQTYEIEDQFFLGNAGILVKPVTTEGSESSAVTVPVYIPTGEVYFDYTNGRFDSGLALGQSGYISKEANLSDIPMFVKGGSIFARRDRYRRSSRLMRKDPYSLVVALGKDNNASGGLYVDDGESYGYKDGKFLKVSFAATNSQILGSSTTGDAEYAESMKGLQIEKITVVGQGDVKKLARVVVTQNGESWPASFTVVEGVVEVQNPQINVVDAWSIHFVEKEVETGAEEHLHDEL